MKKTPGFTLPELLVVTLIIGILIAIAVPGYIKTIETSKADDAVSTLKMIGTTNRMYFLDKSKYASGGGALATANNGAACQASAQPPSYPAADLLGCKYLAAQDWDSKAYLFFANDPAGTDPCGVGNTVACAQRNSADPCYSQWKWGIDQNGKIIPNAAAINACQAVGNACNGYCPPAEN